MYGMNSSWRDYNYLQLYEIICPENRKDQKFFIEEELFRMKIFKVKYKESQDFIYYQDMYFNIVLRSSGDYENDYSKIFFMCWKIGFKRCCRQFYNLVKSVELYIPTSRELNVDVCKGCVIIPESLNSRSLNSQG